MLFGFLQSQDAPHTLVDARLTDGALLNGCHDGIKGLHKVLWSEYNISTGLETAHSRLLVTVLLGDSTHLHGIGHDDVLIA